MGCDGEFGVDRLIRGCRLACWAIEVRCLRLIGLDSNFAVKYRPGVIYVFVGWRGVNVRASRLITFLAMNASIGYGSFVESDASCI